jgi:hypothetical protein
MHAGGLGAMSIGCWSVGARGGPEGSRETVCVTVQVLTNGSNTPGEPVTMRQRRAEVYSNHVEVFQLFCSRRASPSNIRMYS